MLNPFIELARNPVAFFGGLGYLLLLLALTSWTWGFAWTTATTLPPRFKNRRNGTNAWEYRPPPAFIIDVGKVFALLMLDAWAIGAVVWYLGTLG